MRSGLSISIRLTLWFSAIFLSGFIAFGAVIWVNLNASLNRGRDRTLKRRAGRMAELLGHEQNDPDALQKKYADFMEATPEGHLIQVYSLDGKHLLAPNSSAGVRFPWPQVPVNETEYLRSLSYKGLPYRVYVRTTSLNGMPVRIFVGGQLTDNQGQMAQLTEILERTTPVMLLISALAGYFISRRALMPVVRLTDSARSITIGNLAARLPVSPSGDELARLAETCNEMLGRLDLAVKRITQFTADASHELRSPIAFIRATSEYALSTPGLDTEAAEAFRSIVGETDHSLRLLEDMLLLARFDAGRAPLAFEPIFLTEIVQGVVTRIRVLAQEKRQRLTESVAEVDLQLSGDALMLRRLVWILLDNAIKYTPIEGSIEVALKRKGDCALLTVSDNGTGIPETLLPRIFDRFFRADPSRGEQDGTGLGLAIAKHIVETHGASIDAHSKRGIGTTFEVAFPLIESAA